MNGTFSQAIRFALSLVAGFGGIYVGGIVGAIVGRFVTGEQGLHGLDATALFFVLVGILVGLCTGVRLGNVIGTKLTRVRLQAGDLPKPCVESQSLRFHRTRKLL